MFPLSAIAAIPSIFQGIQGITQMVKGKRDLNDLVRPEYEIPTAARQSLALARSAYADPRMPGESRAYDRIGGAYSNYLRASRDAGGGSGLAGLAMAQANTNAAYGDLATQSANNQRQDQQNLMSNLSNYANYQDQQFQLNKFAPYAQKYNEAREMIGAGQQNTFGALNGLSSIGMQMLGGQRTPIDSSTISSAQQSAQTGISQDAFLNAAARLAKQGAISNYKAGQAAGMTPADMLNAYRNYKTGQ